MRILHVVVGLSDSCNGIAVAVKLIAAQQRKDGHEVNLVETAEFISTPHSIPCGASMDLAKAGALSAYAEIWVHSMWLPETIKACRLVLNAGVPLVRMTHANLDPLRLHSKGWKKLPVWYLIERRLLNRSARVIATCAAEVRWNREAGVTAPVEMIDLARIFDFKIGAKCQTPRANSQTLHVLYLGRRHPLKGVAFLEQAVEALNRATRSDLPVQLRIVADHAGAELERDWAWADVLCLPTLSENFGLVVAEALQRGKRVITTDGAPAWESQPGVVYIRGFRNGTDSDRVRLLADALRVMCQ